MSPAAVPSFGPTHSLSWGTQQARVKGHAPKERLLLYEPLEVEHDNNTAQCLRSPQEQQQQQYSSLHDVGDVTTTLTSASVTLARSNPSVTLSSYSDVAPKPNQETLIQEQQQHLVLPSDTLTGLLLTYKIGKRALRRANPGWGLLSSDGLRLEAQPGDVLVIPAGALPHQQDTSSLEYKVASVLQKCQHLTIPQAQWYVWVIFMGADYRLLDLFDSRAKCPHVFYTVQLLVEPWGKGR